MFGSSGFEVLSLRETFTQMLLRLILKTFQYCRSLIKDIFGLHDIMCLLKCGRGRHKVFIT